MEIKYPNWKKKPYFYPDNPTAAKTDMAGWVENTWLWEIYIFFTFSLGRRKKTFTGGHLALETHFVGDPTEPGFLTEPFAARFALSQNGCSFAY